MQRQGTVSTSFRQAKEKEEADRLAAEQARLAREAAEDAARIEKQRKEEEKMARIQAGVCQNSVQTLI